MSILSTIAVVHLARICTIMMNMKCHHAVLKVMKIHLIPGHAVQTNIR